MHDPSFEEPPFSNEYTYPALHDSEQIRILRIHPGVGAETVSCSLLPATLTSKYEALSYTWGTDTPGLIIKIRANKNRPEWESDKPFNDKAFRVTLNLLSALVSLRSVDHDVMLWVDAICINQEDDDEKRTQVAMMADIYRQAQSVIIWLGRPTFSCPTDVAFRFITRLCMSFRNFDNLLTEEYIPEWEAFEKVLHSPWFSRRWVIQELVFARNAVIYSGQNGIHWSDFAAAVTFFALKRKQIDILLRKMHLLNVDAHTSEAISPYWELHGAIALVDTTSNLVTFNEDGHTMECGMTLEMLVRRFLAYDASDPRDVIYAILSLAKDTQRNRKQQPSVGLSEARVSGSLQLDHIQGQEGDDAEDQTMGELSTKYHGIVPDYEKDVLDVFKDFVHYCIVTSKSLDIICRRWVSVIHSSHNLAAWEVKKGVTLDQKNWAISRKPASWMPTLEPRMWYSREIPIRRFSSSLVGESDHRRYNASFGLLADTSPQGNVSFGTVEEPLYLFELRKSLKECMSGSPSLNMQPRQVSDGSITVTGLLVGIVDDISDTCFNGYIPIEALNIAGDLLSKDGQSLNHDVAVDIWRTMVADRGPDGRKAPQWYARAFEEVIYSIQTTSIIDTGRQVQVEKSSFLREFIERVRDVVSNRAFFRSQGIHHLSVKPRLGLGPAETMKGDIICILYGCSVPVVLRQINIDQDAGYRLIGECYLHGVMDGEAISRLTKKQLLQIENKFKLC